MSNREQWEALIIESFHWRRPREIDYESRYIEFDREDVASLDDTLQLDFRRMGGFSAPLADIHRIDHPLARFYRLMYTPEFEWFRESTLNDISGVSGMSLGVREMLIDQIFRYFVFVSDSVNDARRFGQLICAIAVFRNTYDDDSKKFVENGILKSRKRLFKSHERARELRREGVTSDYSHLGREGIPADYETRLANKVREWLDAPPYVSEEIVLEFFKNFRTEGLGFTDPLPVSTCVYSPLRRTVLHVMHLMTSFVGDNMKQVDLIYTGTVPGSILQTIREIIPSNVRMFPTLDKVNPNHYTLVVMDDEFDKESSSSPGDDQQFMQQITLVRGLKNTFRNNPDNLLAVSVTFRVPTVLSGPGKFEFLPGRIFNTPWKNPQDERMRLVWVGGMSTEPIEYSVKDIVSSRKIHDYVIRNLISHRPEQSAEIESMGLIDGEFDSELERRIVKRYYDNFPVGSKTWSEVAQSDIITSPRFLGETPMFGRIEELYRFFKFVTEYHLSIPGNPLVQHASRCSRSGLFPVINLADTPTKESIQKIFGDTEAPLIYKTFLSVEEEKRNVILSIREKNLLPRVREKTIVFNILKDLTEKYKDIVEFEPKFERSSPNFVYELVGGMRGSVSIVHLGDSFGNVLRETVENLRYMRLPITEILYESSFPLSDIWKDISEDIISFHRLKNAFGLLERIEKLRTPFFIIRGYGYPQEIYDSVIRSVEKSDLYQGRIEVLNGSIETYPQMITVSPTRKMANIISEIYLSEIPSQGSSCLMIGSEYEFDLSFLSEKKFNRVFHVVESGAGGRKVASMSRHLKRINNKIFVQENLSTSFVCPIEDVTFDVIIVHHSVFSRVANDGNFTVRFFEEVRKCMTDNSKLIALDLDNLVTEMKERGQSMDGSRVTYTGDMYSGEVGNQTYKVFNSRGYIYSKDDLYRNCSELGFFFDNNSSEHRLFRVNVITKKSKMTSIIEPFMSYEGHAVDEGSKVRSYNNLVKRILIEGSQDHTRVLDLACGHGQDIGKWFSHENMELYLGMDASTGAIEEGEKRLRAKRGFKPRVARFLPRDIFGSQNWVFDAEGFLRGKSLFTTISCQLAIHYAFKDERTIKRFMYNVSNLLELGGEFIVTTIDDEVLRSMLESVDDVQVETSDVLDIRGDHYHIKIDSNMYSAVFGPVVMPGVSYDFTQFPSDPHSRTTTEYVVDNRYFKMLAEDMGLQLVSRRNFLDMQPTEDIQIDKERSEMTRADRELTSFYTTYRFVKVTEAKESLGGLAQTFSYSESMKQYQQTMEVLSFGTAEKLGSFKNGLFMNPESLFPAPFVNSGYESIDVITDDISQVKPLYQQLKSRGRLTNKEVVHLTGLYARKTMLYDMIYLSHSGVDKYETVLDRLKEGGSLMGTYVSLDTADRVLMGDSEFSNSIFSIVMNRTANTYAINSGIESDTTYPFFDMNRFKDRMKEFGLEVSVISTDSWQQDSKLSVPQKQFLSIFGMFRVTKSAPLEIVPTQPRITEPEPEEPSQQSSVDKFVLLPGLVQKKAPGKGRDESLVSKGSLYKDLAKDQRWRFKLSDDWESTEFPVRMTSGEMFSSVTNAMIYYKCRFADEENKEYLGINLASGLPVPTDMKPFTKAIRGKKGQQWKEQELQTLRSVYEAKFANTPNAVDEPDNLTPLKALLLTGNAQLYSNSKTRNEMLENIRTVLQRIVGI